jgi:hypothetical protein
MTKEVTTIENVTPEKAARWLANNIPGNRPLRANWVKFLAEEITNGAFVRTHQGIAFDEEGRLRLKAEELVATGEVVVCGVELALREAFPNLFDDVSADELAAIEVQTLADRLVEGERAP